MGTQPAQGRTDDYDALHRDYVLLQRQVDDLSAIREIGLAINSSIELHEALPTIANVVHGALDVRKLTIYEFQGRSAARPVIAKYGRDLITRERLDEDAAPLQGTPLGEAVSTRAPVVLNSDYGSEAYIPLIAKNVPLGVLRIEDRSDGTPFGEEDTPLFLAIGSMIAVAIHNAQLYAMAVTDGLTGLYVRRYFDLRMEEELDQAKRYGRVFSLLLFDIDHFKKFNDTHGHQTGDLVLKQFASLLRENTRKSDICCRYGGEEMAVIIPENGMEDAEVLANKLCHVVRIHPFKGAGEQELHVTTSIGVAEYRDVYKTPADMVKAADEALYLAKQSGRNRVELAQ